MNESSSALVAYADAATTTADIVARIDDNLWSRPGLGEGDLRALVGHTSRALVNVLTDLDRPARTEDISSPQAYYTLHSAQTGEGADAAAVVQRGRQAGAALGADPAAAFGGLADPAAAFGGLADRAVARLSEAHPDDLVETVAGGIRVGSYVPPAPSNSSSTVSTSPR